MAQAAARRGSTGIPLPTVFHSLHARGADICRGGLTLIVGPPSAGKSLLANAIVAMAKVPTLAFLLDGNELMASARYAAILTGDDFKVAKQGIMDGEAKYLDALASMPDMQAVFYAPGIDDVQLQLDAYEQRYGLPPDVLLLDNLGNQSSAFDNEWAVLKAMTLELDLMARREQCAVIATHHTTDLDSCEPAARSKILGKITQYPRLVLSCGFNPETGQMKVGIVKNSEGRTDKEAKDPVILYAEPSRMQVREYPPPPPVQYEPYTTDQIHAQRWGY